MSVSAQLPKMALQLFEPDPHAVYSIETAANLAQMSRRMILVYCRHGRISPMTEPGNRGYYFSGNAVRTLRRIQNLRIAGGINIAGVKIILNLSNKVEQLRSAVMHNGSPIP